MWKKRINKQNTLHDHVIFILNNDVFNHLHKSRVINNPWLVRWFSICVTCILFPQFYYWRPYVSIHTFKNNSFQRLWLCREERLLIVTIEMKICTKPLRITESRQTKADTRYLAYWVIVFQTHHMRFNNINAGFCQA